MLSGNYLITGATGLMGTTALKRFSNMPGVKLRAVYHRKKPFVYADNISYVYADLTNKKKCKEIVKDIDYVFMFASILSTAPRIARNPVSHTTETIIMNAQMLEAAYFADVKKFIWLSSSTGYPVKESALKEEQMFEGDPPDIYFPVGWMSRYTEVLGRMYATKLKESMPIVILRPTTIYGEYESFQLENCHVLPALIRKVVERRKPIEVWGTGDVSRDLIYSGDVLDACIIAMEKVDIFDVFNIGFGRQYTVNEMLKTIIEIDKYDDAKIVYNTSKPFTIKKRVVDLTKAKEKLGFEIRTSLEEGVSKMIHHYKHKIAKGV